MNPKTALANFVYDKKVKAKQWYKETFAEKQGEKLYNENPPKLDEVQKRVTNELLTKGISLVDINELFPDGKWWQRLSKFTNDFVQREEVQDYIYRYKNGLSLEGTIADKYAKKYLYRKYNVERDKPVDFNDEFIQFGIEERMLDIVSAYFKRYAKLRGIDLWYNIAGGTEKAPEHSQNWHRDGEDSELVKVFLYFNDIDETAGPFTYIPETHSRGKYGDLYPASNKFTNMYGGSYPTREEVEGKFTQQQIKVCTAKAGTLIFCDTNGIHRGGFCTLKDRILGNWIYTTPSSFTDNITKVSKPANAGGLSVKAKFALSF
jgi:hypothetical protein